MQITISGLTTEQADNVIRAIDKYEHTVSKPIFRRAYNTNDSWTISSDDWATCGMLCSVLLDEDSGADYLI